MRWEKYLERIKKNLSWIVDHYGLKSADDIIAFFGTKGVKVPNRKELEARCEGLFVSSNVPQDKQHNPEASKKMPQKRSLKSPKKKGHKKASPS